MSNWYEAWADRYAEWSAGVTADVPFYVALAREADGLLVELAVGVTSSTWARLSRFVGTATATSARCGLRQSPETSATDRGKWAAENVIAPAGTIQGTTLTEYRPARTAGSASLRARACSGSTLRIESPRNSSSKSGPAAKR